MRKSLWTILVVFVFTALASTSARADSIVASGGNVTAINGITIAVTTYNVTFGSTVDTTFAGDPSGASTANADILSDLNSGTYFAAGFACYIGVDGGLNTYQDESHFTLGIPCAGPVGPGNWGTVPAFSTIDYAALVTAFPIAYAWDEFTVAAPISTPEAGTLPLMLTGVGLLGLLVVMRKRGDLRHPQST